MRVGSLYRAGGCGEGRRTIRRGRAAEHCAAWSRSAREGGRRWSPFSPHTLHISMLHCLGAQPEKQSPLLRAERDLDTLGVASLLPLLMMVDGLHLIGRRRARAEHEQAPPREARRALKGP